MKKNSSPQGGQPQQEAKLEGRILARVHARESLAAVLGGGTNLTYKGDISDTDDPEPP